MELWATIGTIGPRRSVEITHLFPVERGELWAAVTRPDILARWFGDVTISGEDYSVSFPDAGGHVNRGRIIDCEPLEHLLLTFGAAGEETESGELSLALSEAPSGTLFTFTHAPVLAIIAAEYAAGWQDFFQGLARELGGSGADDATYPQLLDAYRQREAAIVAGHYEETATGWAVDIERELAAPLARIWPFLSQSDALGSWLWPVVEWPDDPSRSRSLRVGDRFVLGDENMPDGLQPFAVLDIDELRSVLLSWGREGTELRIQLEDRGASTVLRLHQGPAPAVFAAGALRGGPDFVAGWHSLIDGLGLILDGVEAERADELWNAAVAIYR